MFSFSHGETEWKPATENLVSCGVQGRASFNIYNVQRAMDMILGWMETASSMIIKDVRWFMLEKQFNQTLQGIITSISSAATPRGGKNNRLLSVS